MRVLKPPLLRSAENSTKIFKEKKAMPQNMCIDPRSSLVSVTRWKEPTYLKHIFKTKTLRQVF